MSLYLKETGAKSAPTILFLHGMGVSSWMWDEQIASLEADYHCIAVDLPGNGESYREEWHSFKDSADQIAAIIRNYSANGKAHIVGLSLGGYTALFLLQHHPEVVETMIVSGVSTRPFERQWLWQNLANAMPLLMKLDPFINLNIAMMQLPPEVAPLYKRDSKRIKSQTFQRVYAEVLNFTLPQILAQRTPPFLAVAGDKEAKEIMNGLADFAALLPNAQTSLVPNAHHGWNGEHPMLFNAMIRGWIEAQMLPDELCQSEKSMEKQV